MDTTKDVKAPGPPRLSKAAVVDQALALADALGPDALTIRRLAQDLGVTPMALYWHFRSKDELLEALGDRVWSLIDIDVDAGAPWPAQFRALMESFVHLLRAHPAASPLLMSGRQQKMESDASLRVIEKVLGVLRRGGFSPKEANEIAGTAMWTGLTLVMSEPGFDPASTPEQRTEQQRQHRIRLALLPPDRFPRLVECAAAMTAPDDPEDHYRFGIDLFTAGVTAMAQRGGPERRGSAGAADPAAG